MVCRSQYITGTVVDSQGNGIAFANVMLYQSADSAFVDGCTSDDNGDFFFTSESAEGRFLRVSFVGYKKACVNEIGESPLRITLEPTALLDGVVVVAQRKLYDKKMEKS